MTIIICSVSNSDVGHMLSNHHTICPKIQYFCLLYPACFLNAAVTLGKTMTVIMCNELAVSQSLKWFLQRQRHDVWSSRLVIIFKVTLVNQEVWNKMAVKQSQPAFKWVQVAYYMLSVCDNTVINNDKLQNLLPSTDRKKRITLNRN